MEEIIENVIGVEALYASMLKCKKGVVWKDSVAGFYLRAGERIINLANDLQKGTYKPKPPTHFMITSPKPREIASIAFRDRVYQRSLNDNVVYPTMVKSFIYDNYACQKGKGTDAARDRIKEFLHKYYRKHGYSGYVCQFDIKGYYPNMNHAMTENVFKRKLDPWTYSKVESILREQYQGTSGYNPGSQLVQIAGISVLDRMDHYIKEKLHIKFYIRYMDDFILIHPDEAYLEQCKEKIIHYLSGIKYEINQKKTRIFSIKEGIEFLGFRFKLTESGKVLMLIKSENVKRERKKLYRLVQRCQRGELPHSSVDDSYHAWRTHASKGNSYKLIQRMDNYYRSLWTEVKNHVRDQTQNTSGTTGGD